MLHGTDLSASAAPSCAGLNAWSKGLSQIASVSDATARAALVSGLTVTAASPVWVYRQDTGVVEVSTDGTTWQPWLPAVSGWAVKTDGFQGSLSSGAAVALVQGGLSGGMAWSSANGGGLVVPVAGTYTVVAYTHFSGASGSTILAQVLRWRSGAVTSVIKTHPLTKDGEDWPITASAPVECLAGDIFTLQAKASTCSVWGDSAKTGTRLSVQRLL